MIDDPMNWYKKCAEYAIDNKHSPMQYGYFFFIKDDTPKEVVEMYKEYVKLCVKPFMNNVSWCRKSDGTIEFNDDRDLYREQSKIVERLIKDGYLPKTLYIS